MKKIIKPIIILLTTMLILFFMVIKNIGDSTDGHIPHKQMQKLRAIEEGIKAYWMVYGREPEIKILKEELLGTSQRNKKKFVDSRPFVDYWGTEIKVGKTDDIFHLRFAGEDQKFFTDDDIAREFKINL